MRVLTPWQPSAEMANFLETLAAGPYQWRVKENGIIRTNDPYGDCPISANARHLTGQRFCPSDWQKAAAAIGLPYAEAQKVVLAADNKLFRILTWGRILTRGRVKKLRAMLLAATVDRQATREVPAPAPDPMDRALANLVAKGISAEPAGEELAAV